MKNADKPINAVLTQSISLQNETSLGLTKREYFAGLAMQGILSSQTEMRSNGFSLTKEEIKYICEESVLLADELLKQLETTKD
jgi:hypothetical protein